MQTQIDSLKLRHEAVLRSPSDPLFYQNLHLYFDYIVRTPILNGLFEASAKEYSAQHRKIWEPVPGQKGFSEQDADEREERTYRLERFNLYAVGCTIYMRIYLPIDDYIKSIDQSEFEQDPKVVLMFRSIKRINPEYAKRNPFKWGHEQIIIWNRWFEGQRERYQKELSQFHLLLLDAIDKATLIPSVSEPIPEQNKKEHLMILNPRTGDYRFHEQTGTFSPTSHEFKVLYTLYENLDHQASYLELLQAMHPQVLEATKSNKLPLHAVINKLRNELGKDAVINVKNIGYRLILKLPAGK